MAEWVGLYGNTGSGKTTSLRNLDEKKTFLFQTVEKLIPFKNGKKKFTKISKENPIGNLTITADYAQIVKQLTYISNKRPEIDLVILDDSSYLLTEDYFDGLKSAKKGDAVYSLYNSIASDFWQLLKCIRGLRSDLLIVLIAHTQENELSPRSFKTVGKLLDNQLIIEGLTSVILESKIINKKYVFQTNKVSNQDPCKSPMGMFENMYIPNDLNIAIETIRKYL
jgi:hypothetical protein